MSDTQLDLASPGRTVRENIDLALLAASCGWGGFWVAETTGADAVTTASAVAARLATGRVGTAIVPVQTRNPMLLAMSAASIGQIAPGGFTLGLGTSTPIIVEDWHATPWGDSPLTLTRECVDLTRRLLAGERVTTESGRWRFRRAQLLAPPESPPPIYLGRSMIACWSWPGR
ncbi:MAG: LLM class flavin-dependent oxidoreductase [Gammaproteobacteria bacterium]|nr:LLM class flavin-dependent oxidoreductase [Gammaproteobacteria bacterium]